MYNGPKDELKSRAIRAELGRGVLAVYGHGREGLLGLLGGMA